MMRANWFVALPVPAADWFARLAPPPLGVRLFHPDDLHLTVAFLGAVDEAAARRAFAPASSIALPATEITLGDVVPMGSPRHASALSALLVEGEEAVAAAIGGVRDGACDAAGVPRDARAVLPHLTVARLGRRLPPSERTAGLRWARALALGRPRLVVSQLALFTWSTDRRARLFQTIETMALR